jgi:dihydroorotase
MKTLRVSNGRVIDPAQDIDRVADLWLRGDRILGIGPQTGVVADETLDAAGKIVCPGLIDMHVHLREPGREEDETVATGTAAALAGGVTSVACMPNTEPPLDDPRQIQFVLRKAREAGGANVWPTGCVTKGRQGRETVDFRALAEAGAVAFTDDGSPVFNGAIMRRALEETAKIGKAVLVHAEIPELSNGTIMAEGAVSRALGVAGMPGAAEDVMVYRDVVLAELTGGRVHILHVSTAESVELLRRGRRRGARVSGEACPHHFMLTDECLRGRDTNYKMAPPLRTKADVEAIIEGLKDGTLEVIATDHAPHGAGKKARPFEQAPNGVIGLETLLPVCVTALVEPGHLTWPQLIAKLTVNPARVLGIDRGTLRPGAVADVTVIDPDTEWTIDPTRFRSRSRNCPFAGWKVRGRAETVIVGGEVKAVRLPASTSA